MISYPEVQVGFSETSGTASNVIQLLDVIVKHIFVQLFKLEFYLTLNPKTFLQLA